MHVYIEDSRYSIQCLYPRTGLKCRWYLQHMRIYDIYEVIDTRKGWARARIWLMHIWANYNYTLESDHLHSIYMNDTSHCPPRYMATFSVMQSKCQRHIHCSCLSWVGYVFKRRQGVGDAERLPSTISKYTISVADGVQLNVSTEHNAEMESSSCSPSCRKWDKQARAWAMIRQCKYTTQAIHRTEHPWQQKLTAELSSDTRREVTTDCA